MGAVDLPKYNDFHWSTLQALRALGGSGSIDEINQRFLADSDFTEEQRSVLHNDGPKTEIEYRVDWARTYLKGMGLAENPDTGFWSLTDEGWRVEEADIPSLRRAYLDRMSKERKARQAPGAEDVVTDSTLADSDVSKVRYWLYAPGKGASLWDELHDRGEMSIGWEEIGDLSLYASKENMKDAMREAFGTTDSYKNQAHATWQFANEMKPGDIVFAKKGMHELVGRGKVKSDYQFEPERGVDRSNIRDVEWINSGSWEHPGQAVMKTLTDITPDKEYVAKLEALFTDSDEVEVEEEQKTYPPYSAQDYLNDVYMSEDQYETLRYLIRTKKNVILEGAPGVGKTFLAKRLAYSIMGVKDTSRVMMLQFHQSYAYEDFIEGYRPHETGFELRKGPFYKFCKQAEIDSDNDYFVIIDEINRGNLSKIFGELFMLIEADKRGVPLSLLYSEEAFSVPRNIRIIGMMNTADRGLAILDYALRRRFAFYTVQPGFDSDGFREYESKMNSHEFSKLISAVKALNDEIKKDEALGEGFVIGHSYLCELKEDTVSPERLGRIIDFELAPLLKEYWFDEPDKASDWTSRLRVAIK